MPMETRPAARIWNVRDKRLKSNTGRICCPAVRSFPSQLRGRNRKRSKQSNCKNQWWVHQLKRSRRVAHATKDYLSLYGRCLVVPEWCSCDIATNKRRKPSIVEKNIFFPAFCWWLYSDTTYLSSDTCRTFEWGSPQCQTEAGCV